MREIHPSIVATAKRLGTPTYAVSMALTALAGTWAEMPALGRHVIDAEE